MVIGGKTMGVLLRCGPCPPVPPLAVEPGALVLASLEARVVREATDFDDVDFALAPWPRRALAPPARGGPYRRPRSIEPIACDSYSRRRLGRWPPDLAGARAPRLDAPTSLGHSARMRALFAVCLLAAAGCGASESGPATPSAAPSTGSTAGALASSSARALFPTPYTADQLRTASRVGRMYVFRVEVPGKPTVLRILAFTRIEAARVEVTTSTKTEAGEAIGAPEPRWATWEELRTHAEFPRDRVTTVDEEITVPAGRFLCTVYTVQKDGGETARFYFAKEMPGPPVLFYSEKGGARGMTSTLVEYRAGGNGT